MVRLFDFIQQGAKFSAAYEHYDGNFHNHFEHHSSAQIDPSSRPPEIQLLNTDHNLRLVNGGDAETTIPKWFGTHRWRQ